MLNKFIKPKWDISAAPRVRARNSALKQVDEIVSSILVSEELTAVEKSQILKEIKSKISDAEESL